MQNDFWHNSVTMGLKISISFKSGDWKNLQTNYYQLFPDMEIHFVNPIAPMKYNKQHSKLFHDFSC